MAFNLNTQKTASWLVWLGHVGRRAGVRAVRDRRPVLRVLLRFVDVVVVVGVQLVVVVVRRRTAQTQGLAAAVVEARGADALAAGVGVEPPVARGAHRHARLATASQRQARRHVRHRAVGRIAGPVKRDHVTSVSTNLAAVRVNTVCHV